MSKFSDRNTSAVGWDGPQIKGNLPRSLVPGKGVLERKSESVIGSLERLYLYLALRGNNNSKRVYFFCSSGLGGGGRGLSESGRFGSIPSPTCSQGERASKFLCIILASGQRVGRAGADLNAWVSCNGS